MPLVKGYNPGIPISPYSMSSTSEGVYTDFNEILEFVESPSSSTFSTQGLELFLGVDLLIVTLQEFPISYSFFMTPFDNHNRA